MLVQLNAPAQAGFDDPLGLMRDCHRRIESFLDIIIEINTSSADGALDAARRGALRTALDYFANAAPNHTRDEEESLFPRLRRTGAREAKMAVWKVAGLEQDHVAADSAHAHVDAIGRNWLERGAIPRRDSEQLANILRGLRNIYQRHITLEDTVLFPLAGRVLDGEQIREMGDEMAARRGLSASCHG